MSRVYVSCSSGAMMTFGSKRPSCAQSETCGTCSFASACRNVSNSSERVVAHRVPRRHRPWADTAGLDKGKRRQAERKAAGAAARQLPWTGVAPGDRDYCPGGRVDLGGVSCLCYGEPTLCRRGVALLLHGNPSDAESMSWLAPALVHAGFQAVAVDMPGFGHSRPPAKGARMHTRSEHTCEPGGAAEVVEAVLTALGAKSCTLIGYDWGAGIALSMGCSPRYKRLVQRTVAMHPAYSEKVRDELCATQAATTIMWAEDNAFHSWARFKPLASKLRQRLGSSKYAEHICKREDSPGWSNAARARVIIQALTGIDPLPTSQTVAVRPERAAVAADGQPIARADGVVFRSDVTEAMVRGPDLEVAACGALIEAERAGKLPGLLRGMAHPGGARHATAMSSFARDLPRLSGGTITPAFLETLGLWSADARAAAEALHERVARSARYFPGRWPILLPASGGCGTLVAIDATADSAVVRMDSSGAETIVSWRALLKLNQRHLLPMSGAGDARDSLMLLEDGLWANFDSPLLRAELAFVALKLEPIFSRDVGPAIAAGDDDALDEARAAAVRAMRSCLDMTSFAREGGLARGRDRERYAKDDVAKMAAYGEGHCRTLSSCMSPFLWTFSELLAIDPHYCTDANGGHQWLQFETRPSMRSFVCDVYRDEGACQQGAPRGRHLAEPAHDAYATDLYPRDEPLELGGRKVTSARLAEGDILYK